MKKHLEYLLNKKWNNRWSRTTIFNIKCICGILCKTVFLPNDINAFQVSVSAPTPALTIAQAILATNPAPLQPLPIAPTQEKDVQLAQQAPLPGDEAPHVQVPQAQRVSSPAEAHAAVLFVPTPSQEEPCAEARSGETIFWGRCSWPLVPFPGQPESHRSRFPQSSGAFRGLQLVPVVPAQEVPFTQ